ncbi:sensor histidine kinase [Amphritea sp.]|uniref:sensor histidine kinase n=1 Tax=Amphritea sp. TaxID=1872502 RepID=UPI0025C2D301|nr:sensor histidine kinase [Amphritea sp.]
MAAKQNEFRVFLRERKYELQALADQFDNPDFYTPNGRYAISSELEGLLRLQVDTRSVYGVVFFDQKGQVVWTFPEEQTVKPASLIHMHDFEDAELIGPSAYSIERPSSVILRQSGRHESSENRGSIGLILRFNSLTEVFRGLGHGGSVRVLLQAGDDNMYDVVGQPSPIISTSTQQRTLLPGWILHVIQDPELVMMPVEAMRYWLLLLMACTVAGLLWLHMSISRRLNRQVESLIDSVEKVALGNLETPVAIVQGVEMHRLTQAIERMRLQLKAFIRSTLAIERQATLGQLAAGLAHDIRNPLTTIRTTVAALSRRERNPESREMMALVEEEIDRVNDVLENLLNFARPRDPYATRLDTAELLNSIVTLVGASARNQGIKLSVDSVDSLVIWADEGHIRQILMNLILNALEAMSVKGSTILLRAVKSANEIKVSVSDDGQGMPDDIQAHIMEPFYTTKPAGTGLGLAICATLAKSNGGRLMIESIDSSGTKVTVFLPAASEEEYE